MSALRDAYELIKDEKRWCRDNAAVDKRGMSVFSTHPDAVRWCASGAMAKVAANTDIELACRPLVAAALVLFPQFPDTGDFEPVVRVNDELGHEAVLQVFEKAIVETEGSL